MKPDTNKFHTSSLAALLTGAVVLAASSAFALDWPRWQGPDRTAMSKETGLLKEWPAGGPSLAWKATELGGGDGGPAIANGKIIGVANRGADEVVWGLSEADGKPLWTWRLGPALKSRMPQSQEGPSCTPTIEGDVIYVEGLSGNVVCLQVADGKIIWQRNLQTDFGGKSPNWSFRESPLIDGDKLICTPGAADATVVALNKKTGEVIWKSAVPGNPGAAYASAIVFDFEGQRQYAQLTAKALIGISAADGKFLWRYDKPANNGGINCVTPIYKDGAVFAASAYGAGGGAVKLSKEADGSIKAEEIFFSKKIQNHHGGVILVDGYIYGANGGNEGGSLVCLDFKNGEVKWDAKTLADKKVVKGSLTFAEGMLYYRMENGTVALVEANPKEYIEHGRFEQPNRTSLPAWAHPVIANGKLYIRDQSTLYCYDIKAAK
jgi:outer membrane protein assembly factor BamB